MTIKTNKNKALAIIKYPLRLACLPLSTTVSRIVFFPGGGNRSLFMIRTARLKEYITTGRGSINKIKRYKLKTMTALPGSSESRYEKNAGDQ